MRKELPSLLGKYKDSDFITRERTRFIYYLCLVVITAILILITTRLVFHPLSNTADPTHIFVLVPLVILLILIGGCFLLLISGHSGLISHLVPLFIIVTIWIILFSAKTSLLTRMDTVVYLFVVFSMIPILIEKSRYTIFLYSGINIILVFILVFSVRNTYNLTPAEMSDYLIDVSMSLGFISVIGYTIHSLNKRALQNAEDDFQQMIRIQGEFLKSQKRYQDLTELLPVVIYESDINGRITFTNQAGYRSFGYSEDDLKAGVNVSTLVCEKESIESNIKQILLGDNSGHNYTAIRKNGEKFPITIYTSVIEDEGRVAGFRGVIFDISERMKAEEALRASERKFKDMTFLLPQTVYESDMNGILTFMNKAGTLMFGFSEDDFRKGVNVFDTIAKEYHEQVKESIKTVLSGKTTHGNQYIGQRRDGSTFPIQVHSSPIYENDKITGLRGIIFDISKLKQIEFDLRQSNDLLKTLFESSPISISLYDMEGRFMMVNRAFCNDFGVRPENVLGRTITELGIASDPHKEEMIAKTMDEKGFIENFEISMCNNDGIRIEFYVYATIVTVYNQKAVLRSNVNVTDKKNLENKLRESENLFRTIVDMVPYTITITDPEYRYLFANKAYLKRFNFKLEDIKGKTLKDLGIKIDEKLYQKFEKEFREKGSVMNLELDVTSPANERIITLLSTQPVMVDNKPHIIGTTVDITERKMLEEQLKEYNVRLEELVQNRTEELEATNEELSATNEELIEKNQIIRSKNDELNTAIELIKNTQAQLIQTEKMASLGILTAGVAHEVNNPLNYLMGVYVGFKNYFREHGIKDDKQIESLLDIMHVGIERISGIVRGLNQFSRSNDSLEETCDIHTIIDNCLTMLHNKLKHRIELKKEFCKEDIVIKGNVGRMHQVFVNIISNSIQAIPDKGNIEIKSDISGGKAVIEIIDDGIGIEEINLSKITDPFFTTKSPGEGTGLGLSITQTIVREHNGEIKFESEVSKGTRVILSFPLN